MDAFASSSIGMAMIALCLIVLAMPAAAQAIEEGALRIALVARLPGLD